MEDNAPQAGDEPDLTHITVNVHLHGNPSITCSEQRNGAEPYARLTFGGDLGRGLVVYVHDPEHLRFLARTAMASALRLERMVEAARALPATHVTDADVDAALAEAVATDA